MSGKENYADVPERADGGYGDVTKDTKGMSKVEEARAESSRSRVGGEERQVFPRL